MLQCSSGVEVSGVETVVEIDHDFEFKLTQQERLHINNDYILYTNNDCERPLIEGFRLSFLSGQSFKY